MDSGTFQTNERNVLDDAAENKAPYQANKELEAYRFVFLRYLEAINKLRGLRENIYSVQILKEVFENGWSYEDNAFDAFDEGVRIAAANLCLRYQNERTKEGLFRGILQYEAEMNLADRAEKQAWRSLVAAVDKAVKAVGWDQIWAADGTKNQRELMSNAQDAELRLEYYHLRLTQMDHEPPSPARLEIEFLNWDTGVALTMPFAGR